MSSQPDSEDDAVAFADFTKDLPVETAAQRRERREVGENRAKQSLGEIQTYSLCAGVCAIAITLIVRPMPLLSSIPIAAGTIIGAIVGNISISMHVLLSYLRSGGWLSKERVNVVPTIWFYGPIGAVCGSTFVVFAVSRGTDRANPVAVMPTLLGAIAGILLCAVARLTHRRVQGREKRLVTIFGPRATLCTASPSDRSTTNSPATTSRGRGCSRARARTRSVGR